MHTVCKTLRHDHRGKTESSYCQWLPMLTYKSDLSAHVLRACGLYLCMISSLLYRLHKEKLPMLRSIYSYLQTVTLFSRTPGAKPTSQPCQLWYIDSSFSSFTFPGRTSISASLSAKFRQALRNNIQMYVYRCTLYTTLQNPNWKRKTGSSQWNSDAHLLQQFMKEKRARCCPRCARGVLPRLTDICDKYI